MLRQVERGISQKVLVPALEETRDEFRLTLSLRKSPINLFSHINKSGSLLCEEAKMAPEHSRHPR